jgi:hypothetical protein
VKRECIKIASSPDGKRAIYVDKINKDVILEYIQRDDRHKKKFKFFSDIFLGGHKNTELYDKEDINDRCKDITAIKFFKSQENDRIYCKEVRSKSGVHVVITAILHERKKSQTNSNKEITLINIVANYDYDI